MKGSLKVTILSCLAAATLCLPWGVAQAVPATKATATTPAAVSTSAKAHVPAKPAYRYRTFQTPSGNIHCQGVKSGRKWSLRCDIYEHYWSVSGSCSVGDYGSSVGMRGKHGYARFICVSDAVSGGSVVPYGYNWYMGPMTCKSRSRGLTCWNGEGHGWFLSRESYRLF